MADSIVPSDPPYDAMANATEATDGNCLKFQALSTIPTPNAPGVSMEETYRWFQVRRPPVPMILTRGFNPNAPRQGVPMSSSADPDVRGSGSQQTCMQKTDNHFNQLNIANTVLVAGQDPAMTSLIEATAELRHREHVAERIHGDRLQAVRVQAEQEHQKKVSEVVWMLQERMHAEEARMWERQRWWRKLLNADFETKAKSIEQCWTITLDRLQRAKTNRWNTWRESTLPRLPRRTSRFQSSKVWFACKANRSQISKGRQKISTWRWISFWWEQQHLHWRLERWLCLVPRRLTRHLVLMPRRFTLRYWIRISKREAKPNLGLWMCNGFPSRAAAAATFTVPNLIPPVSPDISAGWSLVMMETGETDKDLLETLVGVVGVLRSREANALARFGNLP